MKTCGEKIGMTAATKKQIRDLAGALRVSEDEAIKIAVRTLAANQLKASKKAS